MHLILIILRSFYSLVMRFYSLCLEFVLGSCGVRICRRKGRSLSVSFQVAPDEVVLFDCARMHLILTIHGSYTFVVKKMQS